MFSFYFSENILLNMKFNELKKQEFLEKLFTIAKNYKTEQNEYFYKNTYPYFLEYFKSLEEIKFEHFVIGLSFTYSWMPTIPKNSDFSEKDKVLNILNGVKKNKMLSISDLDILKRACNNSLVGASKLLHFINPEKYAIWDSKVIKFLNNGKTLYKYREQQYLDYLIFLEDLKQEALLKEVFNEMKEKVGDFISEFRALELIFFNGSKYENS